MRQKSGIIDFSTIEFRTSEAKYRVKYAIELAEKYQTDPDKKARLEAALCVVCHYDRSRIGGATTTCRPCAKCGEIMSFANTCTDVLCESCAKDLGLCKHCGATINLTRPRRVKE